MAHLSTARATHAKSATALTLAFAAALALPTPARADFADDRAAIMGPQKQCDAANETQDRVSMAAYCSLAAQKIAAFTIGGLKTEAWATLRTIEAYDLMVAADGISRTDLELAEDQYRAALAIMNEVVALHPNAYRMELRGSIRKVVSLF